MNGQIDVDASPEKRLFISLLTRDISIVAAFLDLIDNSVNSAIEPFANRLRKASDYLELLQDDNVKPSVDIELTLGNDQVVIRDTAGGISASTAKEHVFKFGRGDEPAALTDRLSVYGIGLKRALFKLGNKITITSEHMEGGFDLVLDVEAWSKEKVVPWTFKITGRPPVQAGMTGTTIRVEELSPEVKNRISNVAFISHLTDSLANTYSFFLEKVTRMTVNGNNVDGANLSLSKNHSSRTIEIDGVTCAITAGIGMPIAGAYRAKSSGWFVLCNGRTVIAADKSVLTGWGEGSGTLPQFQPKHRPFLGTVFLVSENPEALPWNTTKSGINEDSVIWQKVKQEMTVLGRDVISFLDGRYTDEGTEIASQELQRETGGGTVSVLTAAVSRPQTFKAPVSPANKPIKIQYDALYSEVEKIKKYLGRSMSGSEVGRYTFHYFLRNEVGEE